MTKLNKYMMVHNNPGVDCDEVQANWRKLAEVEAGTWIRTSVSYTHLTLPTKRIV